METKQKRFLVLLVTAILLASVFGTTVFAAEPDSVQEPACYNHGDVNGDGVIDRRDAIYTLYSSLFGTEIYPVTQDCDFTGDNAVTRRDAIFVLYASLGTFEDYQLKGTIHQYYDPAWEWTATEEGFSATVTLKCGCGETHTFPSEDKDVVITTGTVTDATCVDAGSVEYVATLSFEGTTYTSSKIVTIPATGHSLEGTQSCTTGIECVNCDYALDALGHSWVQDAEQSTDATCNTKAIQVYVCSVCAETQPEEADGYASHVFKHVEDQIVEGSSCEYVKLYRCDVCQEEQTGESFFQHTYTASLVEEASCSKEGLKRYTCECGDTYDEVIPTNDSHTWVEGDTIDGVTTYSCACGATKTTVRVEDTSASVSKDQLASELQLENAALTLDEETLAGLADDQNIVISVDEVEADTIPLSAEELAQLGGDKVFDFSMEYEDGTAVSEFDGKITISLPYTLQEGDNVDCIDVWFINDDGTVECVEGTYSNGYVTFTTDHFSYYTVTRLTPAQRCEKYGHVTVTSHKDATCTANGHDIVSCKRCGHVEKNEVIPMVAHAYNETITPATCVEDGLSEKICQTCKLKVTAKLPALGHEWKLDEAQSTAATCDAAGKEVYVCAHEGCAESYTKELAQLEHQYKDSDKKDPDCVNKGHKKIKCQLCGHELIESESAPTGHDYLPENAIWTWSEDYSSATVTLVCAYDKDHTKTLKTVITADVKAASCTEGGTVTYTATASFNKADFTDVKTAEVDALGHQPGEEWVSNANQHYRVCTVCEEKIDMTEHVWGDAVVTKAPTCAASGTAVHTCGICGYEKETVLNATGEHNFVNGVCSVCGFEEQTCYHIQNKRIDIDLSGYDLCVGAEIWWYTCDCGANKSLDWSLSCHLEFTGYREEAMPNGETFEVTVSTCTECGLQTEWGIYYELVDKESCLTHDMEWRRMSIDGSVIGEHRLFMMERFHGRHIPLDPVDLAQFGLCGGIAEGNTCYCGTAVYYYVGNTECNWEYSEELSVDGKNVYICSQCGTQRTSFAGDIIVDESTCTHIYTSTIIFEIDGKEVYSWVYKDPWQMHNYQPETYKLLGESCEDGIVITGSCANCGMPYESVNTWHSEFNRVVIDISEYGYCPDAYYAATCPCGEETYYGLIYPEGGSCYWTYLGYDEAAGGNVQVCTNCGLTRISREEYGPKDENCRFEVTEITEYLAESGTVIFTEYSSWLREEHDYEQIPGGLMGDSCEDGVTIKEVCKDCGYSYEWDTYYHHGFAQFSYDLVDYGLCGGTVTYYVCACGEDRWLNNSNIACSWEWVNGDAYSDVFTCSICGVTRTRSYSKAETVDSCLVKRNVTYTYAKDGKTLLTFTFEDRYENHLDIYDMVLLGETCDDGYMLTQRCANCDYTWDRGEWFGCNTWPVAYEMLSQPGQLCGDLYREFSRCACGAYEEEYTAWYNGSCSYTDEYYVEEEDCWANDCSVCGVTRLNHHETIRVPGSCEHQTIGNYTFRKDGIDLFSYEQVSTYRDHSYILSFELLGETCDDGYYVSGSCKFCGEAYNDSELYFGCSTWTVEKDYLNEGADMCGDFVREVNSCACGEYTDTNYYWERNSCNFSDEWLVDDQCYVGTCPDCGATRTYYSEQQDVDDCHYTSTTYYTFSRDGVELFSYEDAYTHEDHNYVYTFNMLDETCQDGYYVHGVCVFCGQEDNDTYLYTDCIWWMTDIEVLCEGDGLCSDVIWYADGCPCGRLCSGWIYEDHSWSDEGWNEETQMTTYICVDCGLQRQYSSRGVQEDGSCTVNVTNHHIYTKDGEILADKQWDYQYDEHNYIYSYTLLGESCEDGYYLAETCIDCGFYYAENGMSVGHGESRIAYYDLTDFGMCGGYVSVYSCACGDNTGFEYNIPCNAHGTDYTDPDTGLRENHCDDCNISYFVGEIGAVNHDTCRYEGTWYVKILRDGETLLNESGFTHYESHDYIVESFELQGETCDDGYAVNMKCLYCDDGYRNEGAGHAAYAFDLIDLLDVNENACGGSVFFNRCACGEESSMSYSYTCEHMFYESWYEEGADGYTHYFEEHTCDTCGFNYLREYYYVTDEANCLTTWYYTDSYYYGDQLIKTYETTDTQDDHTYGDYVYTLLEGSETCEDGILCTRTCKFCGDSYNYQTYGHNMNVVESIDLAPYGSVCGGNLNKLACPCGAYGRYELDDELLCDLGWYGTEHWIDGVVDYAWQWTTEGWISTSSNSYELICAVTDPQCSLKIRMSEYWLREGCDAVEYQTWQLGYDEATGTCQSEFTVATGEHHTLHAYVETSSSATVDGVQLDTTTNTCSDCGSYYVYTDHYENGFQLKHEEEAINTLANGESLRRYDSMTYGVYNAGYNYATEQRFEVTYADGSDYWYQYDYTYDFANGCLRTTVYTNSYGQYNTWQESAHLTTWTNEQLQSATCSQPELRHEKEYCLVCGEVTYENTYTNDPWDHSWDYDGALGMYVCYNCGLENTNGASGSIVIEDLTADHGNGTNYVVGYWNRGDISFISYVSVILDDVAEDENDELLLTDIVVTELDFETDGITAMSFNQAEALAAAAAAMEEAGYTGSYAIRFTFVPRNTEDTLDYAITFDSLTA